MGQRPSKSVVIWDSSEAGKDKEKEKGKATASSTSKPNKGKDGVSNRVWEEDDSALPTPKKSRVTSPNIQVIEKPSESRPQKLTVSLDISLFKDSKDSFEILKGVVLEEDQKNLYENMLELVKELALAGHKV